MFTTSPRVFISGFCNVDKKHVKTCSLGSYQHSWLLFLNTLRCFTTSPSRLRNHQDFMNISDFRDVEGGGNFLMSPAGKSMLKRVFSVHADIFSFRLKKKLSESIDYQRRYSNPDILKKGSFFVRFVNLALISQRPSDLDSHACVLLQW